MTLNPREFVALGIPAQLALADRCALTSDGDRVTVVLDGQYVTSTPLNGRTEAEVAAELMTALVADYT